MRSELKTIILGFAIMLLCGFHMNSGNVPELMFYGLYGGFILIVLGVVLHPKHK